MMSGKPKRRFSWTVPVISVIAVTCLAGSHFINTIIRTRIERAMNSSLVGYHTHLESAHLRLIDGTLFLHGLYVYQEAHPKPAVMESPMLRVSIQWRGLFFRGGGGVFFVSNPR